MTFKELFQRYGVGSLFASVRRLHLEVFELRDEVSTAKEKIDELLIQLEVERREHVTEFKETLRFAYENQKQVDDSEAFGSYPVSNTNIDVDNEDDTIYGRDVKPFSVHRTSREIINEYRDNYEANARVTISEQKRQQLIEDAQKLMDNEE